MTHVLHVSHKVGSTYGRKLMSGHLRRSRGLRVGVNRSGKSLKNTICYQVIFIKVNPLLSRAPQDERSVRHYAIKIDNTGIALLYTSAFKTLIFILKSNINSDCIFKTFVPVTMCPRVGLKALQSVACRVLYKRMALAN